MGWTKTFYILVENNFCLSLKLRLKIIFHNEGGLRILQNKRNRIEDKYLIYYKKKLQIIENPNVQIFCRFSINAFTKVSNDM